LDRSIWLVAIEETTNWCVTRLVSSHQTVKSRSSIGSICMIAAVPHSP